MYPHPHPHVIVKHVGQETLVYDLKSSTAHCLNPISAKIWLLCDGSSSRSVIAERLAADAGLSLESSEQLVHFSLAQFEQSGLMTHATTGPKLTRRDLLDKAVKVAVLPSILGLSVGSPAAASSTVCDCDLTPPASNCPGFGPGMSGQDAGTACFVPGTGCICAATDSDCISSGGGTGIVCESCCRCSCSDIVCAFGQVACNFLGQCICTTDVAMCENPGGGLFGQVCGMC